MAFDKWTLLKVLEVGFTVACLICKRLTDVEANRLFLYLQKLSREWSLLNNVTWDQLGSTIADATYGGYIIITAALLVGRVLGEIPTAKRVMEMILLGIGALLFIVLGSIELAALDSLPEDLVDNAAILGTLSLVTAALFLLDLGGPRAKKTPPESITITRTISPPMEANKEEPQFVIQPEMERIEQYSKAEIFEKPLKKRDKERLQEHGHNGFGPRPTGQNGFKNAQNGYKKMKEDKKAKRFDIYGKDATDGGKVVATGSTESIASNMMEHSPVWSQIRRGQYGKYDIIVPSYIYPRTDGQEPSDSPSGPGDPGYVQYTAKRWGQPSPKTPRHSPTAV